MGRGITLMAAALFLASMAAMASAGAIDVTKMISRHPDFTEFNELLTKTGLAAEINNLKGGVTVFAIKNGMLGSILSQPVDIQKRMLSIHIALEYYDPVKLNKLKKTPITTLFQSSGMANDKQGFLNAVRMSGKVVIGSAVKGSKRVSKVEGVVAVQPYDISVLYVSEPIMAPGVGEPLSAPAPSPEASAPAPAPSSV